MLRSFFLVTVAATLSLSQAEARSQDKPITDSDPDVMDVAKTPTTDLNITKEEIPPILIEAIDKPYDLTDLGRCKQLVAAVERLDTILGPDMDLPQEARDRVSAGRVAKWVVSSFIPFRGLIRELSGANAQERAVRAAIQAGLARRGFLKGVGAQRGCAYPASPATQKVINAYLAQSENDEDSKNDDKKAQEAPKGDEKQDGKAQETTSAGVPIVSEPVVQKVP
ncbi:hypothetical protein [Novosphingobium pentaromativorans]|uniref:Uncharacterized protein n=1 Tax=Novosphingobium pentaromativorans US6-1 TaxID=1088721 RepID=G6EHN7_9SPHN|nr:hypothetical protein [Novosphingobium pentaromativorans]EHJ59197.1 hypothetical protein NSU_3858 [Novosphingobium pentaromativorans US6-1]